MCGRRNCKQEKFRCAAERIAKRKKKFSCAAEKIVKKEKRKKRRGAGARRRCCFKAEINGKGAPGRAAGREAIEEEKNETEKAIDRGYTAF